MTRICWSEYSEVEKSRAMYEAQVQLSAAHSNPGDRKIASEIMRLAKRDKVKPYNWKSVG